jgi:hypothetical protein
MVLFCFTELNSLPLTRSSYTLPEDKIDMSLKSEFIYTGKNSRKDIYDLNIGVTGDSSVGFNFSLIHCDFRDTGLGVSDDILFNFWHFTGDYLGRFLSSGISVVVRVPTGQDAYLDDRYRNLSFGNHEIKFSPVITIRPGLAEYIILNLSYSFREGMDEDFYGGLRINPAKKRTYASFFGLNPFYKGSFLEKKRLENDFVSISGAVLTSRFYPFALFSEIYFSSGVCKTDERRGSLNIEGSGVRPLLLSAGGKYFFNESIYIQIWGAADLLKNQGYIKSRTELSLNAVF